MNQSKNCTAIKALLLLAALCCTSLASAGQVAGTVVQLSGLMTARKADGAVKILSRTSQVESGDTLMTEKNTYALVKFIDNSEITLKPATTFKIGNFAFDTDNPGSDSASFSLVKGGLRSIAGLLGKRNKNRVEMKTPGATIGFSGATFIAEWVEPTAEAVAAAEASRAAYILASTAALGTAMPLQPLMLAQNMPPPPRPGVPPGLYVSVTDGQIVLSNKGGATSFSAGQFGYTPSPQQPPVVVPKNPGLQFTPPPAFTPSTSTTGTTATRSNTVDCEVR